MSDPTGGSGPARRLFLPVTMRGRDEAHRASTPLELLFDLCFVVAVAVLASKLHHGLADGLPAESIVRYVALFVPVWWAWMSYTWHATAFDNGDVASRLLTLAQMAGVLAVAAAVPDAWKGNPAPFAIAHAAMRIPLVLQWLRAARHDVAHRRFALRYVAGSLAAQSLWVAGAFLPVRATVVVFALAVAVDVATPFAATRATPGRVFHAAHIAERYGLFTLIVLGETILAVNIGLREVVAEGRLEAATIVTCAGGLATAFGIWWLYFDSLGRDALERHRRAAFIWGYGHAALYASIAAIGAGVAAQLDAPTAGGAGWFVALPVVLALLSLAWLQVSANLRRSSAGVLAGAAATLAAIASLSGPTTAVTACAAVVAGAVVAESVMRPR